MFAVVSRFFVFLLCWWFVTCYFWLVLLCMFSCYGCCLGCGCLVVICGLDLPVGLVLRGVTVLLL